MEVRSKFRKVGAGGTAMLSNPLPNTALQGALRDKAEIQRGQRIIKGVGIAIVLAAAEMKNKTEADPFNPAAELSDGVYYLLSDDQVRIDAGFR